jgi:hypothetical protein
LNRVDVTALEERADAMRRALAEKGWQMAAIE